MTLFDRLHSLFQRHSPSIQKKVLRFAFMFLCTTIYVTARSVLMFFFCSSVFLYWAFTSLGGEGASIVRHSVPHVRNSSYIMPSSKAQPAKLSLSRDGWAGGRTVCIVYCCRCIFAIQSGIRVFATGHLGKCRHTTHIFVHRFLILLWLGGWNERHAHV